MHKEGFVIATNSLTLQARKLRSLTKMFAWTLSPISSIHHLPTSLNQRQPAHLQPCWRACSSSEIMLIIWSVYFYNNMLHYAICHFSSVLVCVKSFKGVRFLTSEKTLLNKSIWIELKRCFFFLYIYFRCVTCQLITKMM